MEKLVNRLATELAKYEFKELLKKVSKMSFIEAYNKLHGFHLEMGECTCKEELISIHVRFDFNYKHISGTIFRTSHGYCEVYNRVAVWDDVFSSPIIECLEIKKH